MAFPAPATKSSALPQPLTAWAQRAARHVRPYHLVIAAALGLVTVIFIGVVAVLFLISTNFNLLGAVE